MAAQHRTRGAARRRPGGRRTPRGARPGPGRAIRPDAAVAQPRSGSRWSAGSPGGSRPRRPRRPSRRQDVEDLRGDAVAAGLVAGEVGPVQQQHRRPRPHPQRRQRGRASRPARHRRRRGPRAAAPAQSAPVCTDPRPGMPAGAAGARLRDGRRPGSCRRGTPGRASAPSSPCHHVVWPQRPSSPSPGASGADGSGRWPRPDGPARGRAPSGAAAAGTLPGGYRHLVVIYEENHSFDNLYGTWGTVGGDRVDGLAQSRRAQRTQVAQNGTAYRCLLQADVNLATPPLADRCADSGARGAVQRLRQPALVDRPVHRAHGQDLPAAHGLRPQRRPEELPRRAARRLHPRPGAPLLPGAVPARRRPAGPLRHRLGRGRADHGALRHPLAADLRLPARQGRAALRAGRPLLPGGLRRLVPQPPVPHRGAGARGHQRRRPRREDLGARPQRDGQQPTRSTSPPAPTWSTGS